MDLSCRASGRLRGTASSIVITYPDWVQALRWDSTPPDCHANMYEAHNQAETLSISPGSLACRPWPQQFNHTYRPSPVTLMEDPKPPRNPTTR